MTHQVALRGEAYEALRRAKRRGESFSDVVLRVLAEARRRENDPWSFVRGIKTPRHDLEGRLAEVETWRDADRVDEER